MCLATAYLNTADSEPILQDIARMRFDGDHVEMEALLGEEKVILGRVLEIDFLASKVIVERRDTSAAENKPG